MNVRYMLFCGENYYANGGVNDLHMSSADIEELQKSVSDITHNNDVEWWHIYDLELGRIIQGSEVQAWGAPDFIDVFKELDKLIQNHTNISSFGMSTKLKREFQVRCREVKEFSEADPTTPSDWRVEMPDGSLEVAYRGIPVLSTLLDYPELKVTLVDGEE